MKSVVIGGITVEIDEERSKGLEKVDGFWPRDGCQCDGCNAARMARQDGAPSEQTQIIQALGLDCMRPTHSVWTRQSRPTSRRYGQRICCWFAYGRIIGADHTPDVRFDRFNHLWVDSRRPALNSLVQGLAWVEPDEPGLIYIVTSNRLLLLYGEVCSFRQDYSEIDCPVCGSRWRQTGYLKRKSLIPDWKGLPHLNPIVLARKKRIYVEFCVRCGQMEYEIVEDRPPFRRKNTLLRDEQSYWRRLRDGKGSYRLRM